MRPKAVCALEALPLSLQGLLLPKFCRHQIELIPAIFNSILASASFPPCWVLSFALAELVYLWS